MTKKEQQETFDFLRGTIRELREQNQKFHEETNRAIAAINEKVEKKHLPVNFEGGILRAAQEGIDKAISETLMKYDSPLVKLVKSVVEENAAELRGIISDSFVQTIRTENFKQSILSAFSHKVARTIISNNDGLFDKVSNDLKSDQIFKSKMSLAVANVVEECLKERAAKS